MEFLFADPQLSGCTLMTRLLTIALQGDSWANQDVTPLRQLDPTQGPAGITISCSTRRGRGSAHIPAAGFTD